MFGGESGAPGSEAGGGDFNFGGDADVASAPASGTGGDNFDFGDTRSADVASAPASGTGGDDFDFGDTRSADVASASGDINEKVDTASEIELESAGFDIGATAQSAVLSEQGLFTLLYIVVVTLHASMFFQPHGSG